MEQHPELQGRAPSAYHVFINHRGTDVKKNLASLIYHRLADCHRLCVFLDKDEIHPGDTISDAIHTAIQSASVYITIFSKGYAESRWCLEELHWILISHHKCNKKVIPVFCDVEPADLRHIESGCYKNAFDQHQRKRRVRTEEIKKWKKALSEAADISGILFKPKESDHGEILENIVDIVVKEVFKRASLDVAKYPVGLDHAAEDPLISEILSQSDLSDTLIVGIAGMSGVGKTTLVKYLYNLRRLSFNGSSCFLPSARKNDLPSLQGKLFGDLLGYNQDLQHIYSIDERKHLLRHCRILLVLDDVDHIDQIHGLLDIDSVGRGSLILITSCDKDLLRRSSPKTFLYEVKPLDSHHARELFCKHAFPQSKPYEEFEDLVNEFLKICKGLPLSLKVLGEHFVGMSDKEYWKHQLVRFATIPHDDIIETLKVSYDGLNNEEKEAFLDIGCFLVGEETELAIRVLNGLYGSNIVHTLERLHQKCLVDFHYDVQYDDEIECRKPEDIYRGDKLGMHDQLRELARHIARQEFRLLPTRKPLRVSSTNDIDKLWNFQGASHLTIRGFRTSKDESPPDFAWTRGECVHLFVLEVPIDLSSVLRSWEMSGDLVWVRLRNFRFGSRHSRPCINLRKLSVLELQGHRDDIEQFFETFVLTCMDRFSNKACSPLNELNISGMDNEVPTTSGSSSTLDVGRSMKASETYISSAVHQVGVMPHLFSFLKWTGLEYLCKMVITNLASLQSLPINCGELAKLRHLDLSGCTNLTELPKSFSKLLHLQYLALRECRNLSIPVDILGQISTLEHVDFKGCAQLVALPKGIAYQRHLRYLNLLFTSLSQLPEDMDQLDNLKQLRVGSPELTRLPRSVVNLSGLTELIVIQCRNLQCLSPQGIAAPNIKFLTIDCCPIANFTLRKDQRTMGVLKNFTLKKTCVSEICMVEDVYPWLQTVDLSENIQLKQVIALPSTLVRVDLQNCWELETLENLSSLVNLKFLNVNGCFALETLSLQGLISLEEIEAEKCWKLKRIEGLSCLTRLNILKVSTDNEIFWEDVCNFLKSYSSHRLSGKIVQKSDSSRRLSNFMLTGKVVEEKEEGELRRKMFRLQSQYRTGRVNIVSDTKTQYSFKSFPVISWFITNDVRRCSFHLNFYAGNLPLECISTHGRETGGRRLHIFMWTQHSKSFKDFINRDIQFRVGCSCDASGSEMGEVLTERGWLWIVHMDDGVFHRNVFSVCEHIIRTFTPYNWFQAPDDSGREILLRV